jgi:hypothetical protein
MFDRRVGAYQKIRQDHFGDTLAVKMSRKSRGAS